MHFKHPETLYFLFLLVVPVVVHLFQLRRFKKEYFTNVRFLKALTIQSRKSSTIKKWLLLTTRLLLLTAIILAFAQPFFSSTAKGNAPKELYIILDNSFSMQARGKKGELMQRAIQELLETAPESVPFSLLTTTEIFWNTDSKSIQKELQNLKYSATPFDLDPLLNQILARPSRFQKEIVIITDGKGMTTKLLNKGSKQEAISFSIPKAEQQDNVSIDSVFIRQTLDDYYEIGVQLSRYGKKNASASVGVYHEKKLIAKTMVSLKKQKQILPFTIPKKAFQGYVSVEDTGLAYDNTYFFSIGESQKTKIISIGQASASSFLSRIYTNDEFEYQNSSLPQLQFSSLETQDVIILNEVDEISQALQNTVRSFVEKGGTLIVIPSLQSSIPDLNSLLDSSSSIQFRSMNATEKAITTIHFSHPVFRNVFEKPSTNFQYPKTKLSFNFSSTSAPILSYQDQSPFLQSARLGLGTVYIFSAPLMPSNSNFQQSPLIVPVFYKLAQSQETSDVKAHTIGSPDPYYVTTAIPKEGVLRIKNETEQFIPVQQISGTKVKIDLGDYPQQAGNFGVFYSTKKIENTSFNYPRTESDPGSTTEKLTGNYRQLDSLATIFDRIQTENNDNQIWKWFLIFAVVLLLTETAITRFVN